VLPVAAPDAVPVRVERVLDAAGDLLVRHGYQRVTIDAVARRAGIGKGTVYLHFRTKEELFLLVLLRTQRRVVTAMADRMLADPAEVLPARMSRSLYVAIAADPITRPLYLGDPEVLGRLAHEAAQTLGELGARRDAVLVEHLTLLAQAGHLRADRTLEDLRYLQGAVMAGFFFVDGLPLPHGPHDVDARAALLEQTLAAALHAPDTPAPATALAAHVAGRYRSLIQHIDQEWHTRTR
jgi:AcrR family transcriptional regulator